MIHFKNQRGQTLIMFALVIGALMVGLITSIMMALYSADKDISELRIRIESYQATLQFSQAIQQAFSANFTTGGTCLTATDGQLTIIDTVSNGRLCMPNIDVCANNNRYCIAKNPGFQITRLEGSFSETVETVALKKPSSISISLFPEAKAQTMNKSWMPTLAAVPTVTVGISTCTAAPADKCTICKPAVGATANCFKVRICTNSSTNCTATGSYFDAVVAINTKKN